MRIGSAFAIALLLAGASAGTAQTPPAVATPALADKLINQPGGPWNVFGANQTSQLLPTGGPQGYPEVRVTVTAKGANPWDAGAVSLLAKPIGAGDVVLVALYLRAPMLKDGETTPVSYIGLNQAGPPYDMIATASVAVTNQWKLYFASGKATRAFAAAEANVGIHLASDSHVISLGPVRVFNLGPDADLARLPKN